MKHKKNIILIFIVIIASFLRLYKLDSLPLSLYWDEASLGYNAFSILKAGIDEHGTSYPITHFLAYGDAKPPVYIYLTSISMALFGVSELAIRLPSALFGILAIFIIYLISLELGKNWFSKKSQHKSKAFGLFTSFIFAISPWHLQMSRAAFEANVALTFFLIGIYSFFKAKKTPWNYLISAIMFVATWYTFNAYRLFLPPLLVVMGVIYYKDLWQNKKHVIAATILGLLLTAPLIPFVLSDQAKLRFNEVNIFKDHAPVLDANYRMELNQNVIWSKVLYNRRILFGLEFLDGFFDHLKPDFLFFGGDENPRLGIRDQGMMYLIELPLLILGLVILYKKRDRNILFLCIWATLAIMPSAIARETPHALRSLQLIPVLYLIIGLGLTYLFYNHKKLIYLTGILYLVFGLFYVNTYYHHYGRHWSNSWQYGYKQMVEYVSSQQANYDRIYVTNSYGRPYTYMLLYLKYDPRVYVANRNAYGDVFGFTQTDSFDKYFFVAPTEEEKIRYKWLYVGDKNTQIDESKVKKEIKDPNGETVFIIYE